MREPRDPQGGADADSRGNREDAAFNVAAVILAGVDDVEPGGPAQHGPGHPERRRSERAPHGEPGADGGEGEGGAEVVVAEAGEALQEWIGVRNRSTGADNSAGHGFR